MFKSFAYNCVHVWQCMFAYNHARLCWCLESSLVRSSRLMQEDPEAAERLQQLKIKIEQKDQEHMQQVLANA